MAHQTIAHLVFQTPFYFKIPPFQLAYLHASLAILTPLEFAKFATDFAHRKGVFLILSCETTQDSCTSCKQNYLYGTNCIQSCPQGFYNNQQTLQCSNCDSTCAACSAAGPKSCISCANNLLFY
jgi:hypothetical protein